MSLFLLSFFLVYGSLHAYALLKARSALAFGPGTTLSLLPFLGILHVSRGTGTWGPPMRFLAPPEITVVDIVRSAPGDPG